MKDAVPLYAHGEAWDNPTLIANFETEKPVKKAHLYGLLAKRAAGDRRLTELLKEAATSPNNIHTAFFGFIKMAWLPVLAVLAHGDDLLKAELRDWLLAWPASARQMLMDYLSKEDEAVKWLLQSDAVVEPDPDISPTASMEMKTDSRESFIGNLLGRNGSPSTGGAPHDLEGVVVDGMHMADLDLHSIEIRFASFIKCTFERVDLFNAEFQETAFDQCRFDHVNLGKSNWNGSKIANTVFVGCDLRSIEMIGADLHNVIFQDCDFGEAAIGKSNLKDVHFDRCQLAAAAISGNAETGVNWGNQPG